jgi:ketosteroid isomerase-like protein
MSKDSRLPRTPLLFICFAVVACASTNVPQNSPIDEAKAVVQSHERFARSGDLDGIMSNVAEDIVALATDTPLIKGKAAFRDVYAGYLKAGTFDFGHDYEGAEVVAGTVLLHGVARGNFIPSSGQPSPFANNFILVLKRQPSGKFQFWRIAFAPSRRAS